MLTLLQVDFPSSGPWGEAAAQARRELAGDIALTPRLKWKIWTENDKTGRAGGIYLFEDEASARAYLEMHSKRLAGFGITGIRAEVFGVNETLSRVTRAPTGQEGQPTAYRSTA